MWDYLIDERWQENPWENYLKKIEEGVTQKCIEKRKSANDIEIRWNISNAMKKIPALSNIAIEIPNQLPQKLWYPGSGLCTSFALATIERTGIEFQPLDYGSHRAAFKEDFGTSLFVDSSAKKALHLKPGEVFPPENPRWKHEDGKILWDRFGKVNTNRDRNLYNR